MVDFPRLEVNFQKITASFRGWSRQGFLNSSAAELLESHVHDDSDWRVHMWHKTLKGVSTATGRWSGDERAAACGAEILVPGTSAHRQVATVQSGLKSERRDGRAHRL